MTLIFRIFITTSIMLFCLPSNAFGQPSMLLHNLKQLLVPEVGVWLLLAMVIILGLFVAISFRRLHTKKKLSLMRTGRLVQLMHISHLSIWLYDVKAQTYTWYDNNGVPRHKYNKESFAQRLNDVHRKKVENVLREVVSGEKEQVTIEVDSFAEGNPTLGTRLYQITFSILRWDHKKPSVVIAVCNDITDERKRTQRKKDRMLRYQSIFHNVLVDMVFYDENGYVVNMNERMQRLLNLTLDEALERQLTLQEVTAMPDFDIQHFESFLATRFVADDERIEHINPYKAKEGLIYELQLLPMRDKHGTLKGVYGTGRDISEMVVNYQKVQQDIRQLQKANKELTEYVENINFVMGVGGIRTVNYSPKTHTLTIYKGINNIQQKLTQTRCMTLTDESSKKAVMRAFNMMDNRNDQVIEERIKTTLRINGKIIYLLFRIVPVYNQEGEFIDYFGICRDISELKHTEMLLEKQTADALGLENLKNSFLRNMSYEIRTPLNVVVGFSELFEMEHSPEDEEVFIQEIKNSSAFLLELINSILFLSRLDAHMIEINPQYIDFAMCFEAHCHVGCNDNRVEGVEYIVENSYDLLEVEIDESQVGLVIEQIVRNAAQHTTKGYVRARYDYMGDKLMIVIEDTGCGISPRQLSRIFERFVSAGKGTGLGLAICKELVEQMGGTIDISSREGKGTRVWISLPCALRNSQRKGSSSVNLNNALL